MRVVKPMCLGLMTRPFEQARRFHLGVAVLCFVPLGPEDALFSEMGMWKLAAEELPAGQPLDLVMPKRVAEYIVVGRACAPGGTPVQALRATAKFGAATKSLLVTGDVYEEGGRASAPQPFTEMPIDWTRAYGGPRHAENPVGRGMEEVGVPGVGLVVLRPNIADPAVAPEHRRRTAAGFGPIDQAWPQRTRYAGTYDDKWLRNDFPGLARDLDWRFFNAAPADQHLRGPLSGTEDYAFENMHPREAQLQGRLPGLAPRLFLERRGAEGRFEEIPLGLTTVIFFPHRKRAVLIHHGQANLAEEDGRDIVRAVVGVDRAAAPRPAAHYQAVADARADPDKGPLLALRDRDLAPADLLRPDPDIEEMSRLMATENLLAKNGRKDSERRIARARAMVAEYDLDPDEHGPGLLPPDEPPPSLDELPARIDRILAEAEAAEKRAEKAPQTTDAELEKILQGSGLTVAQLRAEHTEKPSGPPTYTAEGTRRDLRATGEHVRAIGGDASEIDEILADPMMNELWEASERGEREAYLAAAHVQAPARQLSDGRSARLRTEELPARGRDLRRANLCGADLSGLDLSGADLTGAWLDAANLRNTNLSGAILKEAVLAHARLEGTRFDKADLTGTNLGASRGAGAVFDGAVLRNAVLARADLTGASLRGADLDGADLMEARLSGAALDGIRARNAVFVRIAIAGCSATGADLESASFIECDLHGVDFGGAKLMSVAFVGCDLRGLRAAGADLRKAVFSGTCDLTEAQFGGTNLAEANLRGAVLVRAALPDAILEGADLSEANLQEADLRHVRARGARFVVADLARAVLARGDFLGAVLSRANLRGADLSEASFYEADLARVLTDGTTRHNAMLQTRMRVRPRAEPAA